MKSGWILFLRAKKLKSIILCFFSPEVTWGALSQYYFSSMFYRASGFIRIIVKPEMSRLDTFWEDFAGE